MAYSNLLLILIFGAILPSFQCFSSRFVHSSLLTRHDTFHRRFQSNSHISAIMTVKTGKEGKPASSADEDLELTRNIIMAHQDKQQGNSVTNSATTVLPSYSPNTASSITSTTSMPIMTHAPQRLKLRPLIILVLGMGAVALFNKPQLVSPLISTVQGWTQTRLLK